MSARNNTKAMLVSGVGELLWDLLPAGKQLGGAPANFVYFATTLGAKGLLVSRVASDDLGNQALRRLNELGLDIEGVMPYAIYETGTATVALENGVPRFTIPEPAAWDSITVSKALLARLADASAICFGTLGRRHAVSRASIRHMVLSVPKTALRIFDVNLRPPFYSKELIDEGLELANVLKLSDEELAIISQMYRLEGTEADRLRELRDRFDLRVIALTKGGAGSLVIDGERVSHQPAMAIDLADTVGAGDSFAAALVIGLLRGDGLDALHARAARLAAYVCSQSGATPPIPNDLLL
jgi:fructokinase